MLAQYIPVMIALLPIAAPFLMALYRLLLSRLPAAEQAQLQSIITSAVNAAEQVYKMTPGSGQAKRQFVVARIEAVLGKRVNPALVEVLLEEAVRALPPSAI
jgi:hypothetical protein